MNEHPIDENASSPSEPAKAPWHPPTLEEVDYSATEISGVGGVYDLTVYSGSH